MSASDLVAQLAAAGTPPELLAAVAKELFAGETAREINAARLKRDRERKALLGTNWESLRQQTFARDGHVCTYCGSTDDLSCDHIVPLIQGGETTPENLTTACLSCNVRKGGRTPKEWLS